MTDDNAFKREVRARMERTGENYTTARRALIAEEQRMPLLVVETTNPRAPELETDEFSFLSYFENYPGERLVITWQAGDDHATLWHSDLDYEPRRLGATFDIELAAHFREAGVPIDELEREAAELDAPIGDVIFSRGEALWARGCWTIIKERMEMLKLAQEPSSTA